MEANLENLIDKIKVEGIQEAEKEAEEKIERAEERSREIIEEAEEEAEEIVKEAEREAEQLRESGEEALKQAQRDTILVTKERITDLLDKIFKAQIRETLTPEFTRKLIMEVVAALGEDEKYEISVSKEDKDRLVEMLFGEAQSELDDERIDLLPEREVSKGIRVSVKDEDVYYDFTDEGLANYLNEFLNPAIQEVLESND